MQYPCSLFESVTYRFSSSLNYEILQLIKENDYALEKKREKRQSHLTSHIDVYCRALHNNCNLAIRDSQGSLSVVACNFEEKGKTSRLKEMIHFK